MTRITQSEFTATFGLDFEVKHLIITNINEWYIFDATLFERLFAQNKKFVEQFIDFEARRLADFRTDFFYKQIAEPFISSISSEVECVYFNVQDYQKPLRNADKSDDNVLIAILCSKRTRLTSPDRIKSPFIIELGIFHGTDTHRIGISH